MDRLRRSLRQSFRRGSAESRGQIVKPNAWNEDDVSVRAGTCSFSVKYLGCVEVYESRGMQVCEDAMKLLRSGRHRSTRGILYISGDGLRVVDAESKGLIVDQTIEKVSFCAPDRNHEKGFAYICREGTTRRWLCHGFHAVRDSGERLSHAVGCAFAVCLERKQKRDREVQLIASQTPSAPVLNGTSSVNLKGRMQSSGTSPFDKSGSEAFKRGSFRHLSLRDRLFDPQHAIPAEPPPMKAMDYPHAIARPQGNRALLKRQGSLRLSANDSELSGTFRRFNSLRISNSSGGISRPVQLSGPETIIEEESVHEVEMKPKNVSSLASAGTADGGDFSQDAQRNEFGFHNLSSSTSHRDLSSFPSPTKGTGKGEQWLLNLTMRARTARALSENVNEGPYPMGRNLSPQSTSNFEMNGRGSLSQWNTEFQAGGPLYTMKAPSTRSSPESPGVPLECSSTNIMDPFEARWNALNPHKLPTTNPFIPTAAAATEAMQ